MSKDKLARQQLLPAEVVERRIHLIRGHKIMLSTDLAELYQVETRALVQAVKRNIDRFPHDFMFQLTAREFANLKSQIVISRWGGIRRAAPYAFTEHGVAMLSSVLNSKRAITVNIAIMRTFVRLRQILASHRELAERMQELEAGQKQHGSILDVLIQQIKRLKMPPARAPKHRIGFVGPEQQ